MAGGGPKPAASAATMAAPVVLVAIGKSWERLEAVKAYVSETSTAPGHTVFRITGWPKDDVMLCLDG